MEPTDVVQLLGIDVATSEEDVEGAAASDRSRPADGATRAGEDSERYLGLANDGLL